MKPVVGRGTSLSRVNPDLVQLLNQRIGPEFLAQGAPIDAEDASSLALVAIGVIHNSFEQWLFNFTHYKSVQVTRTIPVQAFEIAVEGFLSVFSQWFGVTQDLQVIFLVGFFLRHFKDS
jgi:hypothetical protein